MKINHQEVVNLLATNVKEYINNNSYISYPIDMNPKQSAMYENISCLYKTPNGMLTKNITIKHHYLDKELITDETIDNIEDFYKKYMGGIYNSICNAIKKTAKESKYIVIPALPKLDGYYISNCNNVYLRYNEKYQMVNKNTYVVVSFLIGHE